ncbi:MAG: DsrE family protein [Deltaproteobacteria bacterium]|nr:DsrE family protein [Deltaproteobacteria bacterium]
MPSRVALFLSHADATALRLAGSCALTAASMDHRVDVFVFGPAVPALVEAADEPDHPGAPLLRARQAGQVRLLACSASVVEEKVDPAGAERTFDAVVGWPTVLEWSRGVVDRFVF